MTLREIRKLRGMTQVQVAEKMGITQSRVYDIEQTPLDSLIVRTLRAYLDALGGDLVLQVTTQIGPISITDRNRGTE